MRRAGLDYHDYATMKVHSNWQAFLEAENRLRTVCLQ
jgi:tRNA (cytidine/uridine-2'-O-)-methyltransferase